MLGHVSIYKTFLFEFLLLGCIGCGAIFWNDWFCDVVEGEERVIIPLSGTKVTVSSNIIF